MTRTHCRCLQPTVIDRLVHPRVDVLDLQPGDLSLGVRQALNTCSLCLRLPRGRQVLQSRKGVQRRDPTRLLLVEVAPWWRMFLAVRWCQRALLEAVAALEASLWSSPRRELTVVPDIRHRVFGRIVSFFQARACFLAFWFALLPRS